MRRPDLYILLLIFCAQFGLVLASPHSQVMDYINACRIDDWTTECVQTAGKRALPWCTDQRDRASALMRTMQKHSPSTMRVVPATCFGTNVRVYYMPKRDEFLINPVILQTETSEVKWALCRGVDRYFHTAIRVKYLNSYFNEQTTTFTNVDALTIACELESS
jgi:peptide deformylase